MLTRGTIDVANERLRQIHVEGWSIERDVEQHDEGQLVTAALCYAENEGKVFVEARIWPWAGEWWKPTNRRRDLVKAAALLIAEIDRLDACPVPEDTE